MEKSTTRVQCRPLRAMTAHETAACIGQQMQSEKASSPHLKMVLDASPFFLGLRRDLSTLRSVSAMIAVSLCSYAAQNF